MKRIFSLFLALALLVSAVCSAQAGAVADNAVVSGVVKDGGHGYPLYAKITVTGSTSQMLYSDPFTGAYSVTVPQGTTSVFNVEALGVPGYEVKADVFIPGAPAVTRNIELRVANPDACVTPGYARTQVVSYDFETNNGGFVTYGQNQSWQHGIPTSGPWSAHSGTRVWATNLGGNYSNDEASASESPSIDLTTHRGIQVSWWQWLQTWDAFDYGVVEASSNGGGGWSIRYGSEYPWGTTTNGSMSGDYDLAWKQHSFSLDNTWEVSNFKVRFRFKSDWNLIGTAKAGWYFDDVVVTACEPVTGGLVGGFIYDSNYRTTIPLVGAVVRHASGMVGTSIATPGDPNVSDGLYYIFVPGAGGASNLTAEKDQYATTNFPATMTPNQLTRLDIPLPPNYDTYVGADQISKAGFPNTSVTYDLTLLNTGFLSGELLINPVTLPPGPLWPPTLSAHKTGVISGYHAAPVTVTVSIPPFTPAGTVSTALFRTHWLGSLYRVAPPGENMITLTTTALNIAPEGQPQSLTTEEETPLDLTLLALDLNGDAVTYEYTAPAHGSLTGTLPFLTYTPEKDFYGTDTFTFTGSDGTLVSSPAQISIEVTNVNDAPAATTMSSVEWLAREAHTYLDHPFTDADGDTLAYTATFDGGALPAWLSLDPATGQFSGTPANDAAGDHTVVLTADDGHGGTDSASFTLTVLMNPYKLYLAHLSR